MRRRLFPILSAGKVLFMRYEPILIAGAGALGSVYAAMLRAAGHQVSILGRQPQIDAIARDGLRVEGVFGAHHAQGFQLFSDPRQLSGQSFPLIIIAVKSYDTATVAPPVAQWLG